MPDYTKAIINDIEEGKQLSYRVQLSPEEIKRWRTKAINIHKKEDCYYLIYDILLKDNPDKVDFYNTLLKLNDHDYRLTVLQIETEEIKNDKSYRTIAF